MQEYNVSQKDFWARQEHIYRTAYVTIGLFAINVIVFVLCNVGMYRLYDDGAMITEAVLADGQFYRLFTAMFLHADVQHLFNNMLLLALAGAIVENYAGHGFYILLYMVSGIFGNMISMAFELWHSLTWVSMGASGAINGIVGFVIVWIYINRRNFIRNSNVIFRLMLLAGFVVYGCFFQPGANTAAHLGGLLTGIVLGIINIVLLKNNKIMEGLI
jgi:rhomboid protease GluP